MIKRQNQLDISMFLISSALILFASISYYFVYSNINEERAAIEKEAELQELSFKLANASNFLTAEVRKFTVTLDPVHMRNYWTEINVTKTREKVITRLKELDTPIDEFDLLNTAKNNSDDLINTETRAMKLILRVYEVPEDQMEPSIRDYQLTNEDENLSYDEKVNLARELLYNHNYEKNKRKIMEPIGKYDQKMTNRIHEDTLITRRNTNFSRTILFVAILSVVGYLLYIIWFMLYRISIPLKNYLISLKEHEENENPEMIRDKTVGFITELQSLIRKRT